MKQLTLKEAIEYYGTESHKRTYKKKYSLNKKQKMDIKKIILCEFEYVEFFKDQLGHIIIKIDNPREKIFPMINKKNVIGNNTIDDLNQLLLQYILVFLETNELSESEYYNLPFLESKFDILTNFTRQFVKYNTGLAIVNKDFLYLQKQFPLLEIDDKNFHLFKVMHEELSAIINRFRERILMFISTKLDLYKIENIQGAVVRLENTSFNKSKEGKLFYDLRGRYENLSSVMSEQHDVIIDSINSTLEKNLFFRDVFNIEGKSFEKISFLGNDGDEINIEIPIIIFESINKKIKQKEKQLNLIRKFHGKQKPNYLKTEDFKFFDHDGKLLEGKLLEEEIDKIKALGQYFNEEKEYDYRGYKYYIGTNGSDMSFQDRLKVLDKYKKKYYRLKNPINHKFYEISYFTKYYRFNSNMNIYSDYSSYVCDCLEIKRNPNTSELKFNLRNLLKNRFIESMNKQINQQYIYLKNDNLDRLIMKELVDSFSKLITKS
ncbi:hypothetical protein JNUCC83_02965 [Vagococcus sp. JNUCC 83]